jgi:hypothetical protein
MIDEGFAHYRQTYPVRDYDPSRVRSEEELRPITDAEGRRDLTPPPLAGVSFGVPPYAPTSFGTEKYIWAVLPAAVPFALETNADFENGRVTHTNLTSGEPAHSGGEMWIIDSASMVVNGGSGRYPPRSPEELEAVTLAFKACGFRVASMGWDEGVDRPARFVRGTLTWI